MIIISIQKDVIDLGRNEDFIITTVKDKIVNCLCDLYCVAVPIEIQRIHLNLFIFYFLIKCQHFSIDIAIIHDYNLF
jgi:hypothetical protein